MNPRHTGGCALPPRGISNIQHGMSNVQVECASGYCPGSAEHQLGSGHCPEAHPTFYLLPFTFHLTRGARAGALRPLGEYPISSTECPMSKWNAHQGIAPGAPSTSSAVGIVPRRIPPFTSYLLPFTLPEAHGRVRSAPSGNFWASVCPPCHASEDRPNYFLAKAPSKLLTSVTPICYI